MKRTTALLVLLIGVTTIASSQQIVLPPGPISPGTTITVTIVNNTGQTLGLPCGNPLSLQHPDGGVIVHMLQYDCAFPFPPGTTATAQLLIPATGPGSSGSFVLRSHLAAVRLDVGTPSASFPALHSFPWGSQFSYHVISSLPWWSKAWAFCNTSSTPHTFVAGDQLSAYLPGAAAPLATLSLAGYTVPANAMVVGDLPTAGAPPGAYTIESSWMDPGVGSVVVVRHGINATGTGYPFDGLDMNLPGGHVIPAGGVLPVELNVASISWSLTPTYGFCLGVLPGTTPAPNGLVFPLAFDSVVAASLASGIGGLLVANVGTPVQGPYFNTFVASGIGVTHPGLPSLSGVVVRAAAFVLEPTQPIVRVSQGEDLIIQ